jgi:ectoine hydroxylase-related dioxygenase (phytanoyl-CoA dioxygenase family)
MASISQANAQNGTPIDPKDLPEPTRDMERVKQDLAKSGYALLRDALTADQVKRTRDRLEEQAEMEGKTGVANIGDGRFLGRQWSVSADGTEPWQGIRSILNKGKIFHELVEHPAILEATEYLLGPGFILYNASAIVMRGGSSRQQVHGDQIMFTFPTPVPLIANTFYMVTDFDEARGATYFVPGSHRWNQVLEFEAVLDDSGKTVDMREVGEFDCVTPEAPAGTALLFDARTLHGGGENVSGETRLAVSLAYCLPTLRQIDNFCMSISDEVYADMSERLKLLCGFGFAYLGRIDPALGRSNIGSVQFPWIGELHR